MPIAKETGDRPAINRRGLLYAATAAVGIAGIAAAAWPLLDQMNPDARVRAAGDIVGVDLGGLEPAERRVLRWKNYPIFVVRRTAAMLKAMQETSFVATLVDPDSAKRQQPAYARNWHRSLDPAYAVLVGVCTACSCVPEYFAEASAINVAGGYICPCCASHYDPAGRAYSGPAQFNLPVPPYASAGASKILLGKNATDEMYSLETIERM
ncbi:MAG TPA: ubiquinol-cytochrome c reductase iron-sulfur subunit [Xanthobacteraceae bacterium]|nr:ubiquinol-cytochrome c reductase iron-sulfur subunit [Xanthobacteraceae bacterium]